MKFTYIVMRIGLCPHHTRFTQGFLEHGILHGINVVTKNKAMKIDVLSGLFIIEWE